MHESLGEVYERQGRSQDAIEHWRKATALAGDAELVAILSAADVKRCFAGAVRAVAAKRLERLIARTKSGEYVSAINFARAFLRLGDKEQALRWLKTSCEDRNVHSLTIGSDPFYDPLRTDRRFNKLLQRMKLRV